MITSPIVVISDNPGERNRREKNSIFGYLCLRLGEFFQHSGEADGVALSSAFWELPSKLRVPFPTHLLTGLGFTALPKNT